MFLRVLPGLLPGALLAGVLAACLAHAEEPAAAPVATPVERGRYLAAAGNCISCHTRSGGAAYAGGVPFDTPMGVIHSTNITPDAATGIGKWSVQDFRRAMHEGVAPDGRHLFPAFPYTSFTKVSDADIDDLYAFLKSLKPERQPAFDNGAMFAMRWPMAMWNWLQFKPGRYAARADQTAEWNRGAYLVEGLLHCGACHTPRNWMLAERADQPLQGGVLEGDVGNGASRAWSAVDLRSGHGGLSGWSVEDLARYLQRGVSSKAGTFGPMNEVIVNSTRLLTPTDLRAVAVYIKSLKHEAMRAAPPAAVGGGAAAAEAAAGAALYKDRCGKCHGPSGRGSVFSGPPVAGSAVVQADDPASLINVILFGPQLAPEVSYGQWETMKAYGDVLDDAQVATLANYLRSTWGNRGAPITPAAVAKQR